MDEPPKQRFSVVGADTRLELSDKVGSNPLLLLLFTILGMEVKTMQNVDKISSLRLLSYCLVAGVQGHSKFRVKPHNKEQINYLEITKTGKN